MQPLSESRKSSTSVSPAWRAFRKTVRANLLDNTLPMTEGDSDTLMALACLPDDLRFHCLDAFRHIVSVAAEIQDEREAAELHVNPAELLAAGLRIKQLAERRAVEALQ